MFVYLNILYNNNRVVGQHYIMLQNLIENEGETVLPSFNLDDLEKWAIQKSMTRHQGNITRAAEELGLQPHVLRYWEEEFEGKKFFIKIYMIILVVFSYKKRKNLINKMQKLYLKKGIYLKYIVF